jgi:hypothetical protein
MWCLVCIEEGPGRGRDDVYLENSDDRLTPVEGLAQ